MAGHGQVRLGAVQHDVQEQFLVRLQRTQQVVLLGQADQDVFDRVVELERVGDLALGLLRKRSSMSDPR